MNNLRKRRRNRKNSSFKKILWAVDKEIFKMKTQCHKAKAVQNLHRHNNNNFRNSNKLLSNNTSTNIYRKNCLHLHNPNKNSFANRYYPTIAQSTAKANKYHRKSSKRH